jgi:hypothetical protein
MITWDCVAVETACGNVSWQLSNVSYSACPLGLPAMYVLAVAVVRYVCWRWVNVIRQGSSLCWSALYWGLYIFCFCFAAQECIYNHWQNIADSYSYSSTSVSNTRCLMSTICECISFFNLAPVTKGARKISKNCVGAPWRTVISL